MATSTGVKRKLSGSTDGKPILIAATSSPGTTIHTAVAGTTAGTYDELWLWATAIGGDQVILDDIVARTIYLEFGGTDAENQMIFVVPSGTNNTLNKGIFPICLGLILQNSAVVRAYAGVANSSTIMGFVNSMTD